MPLGDIASSLFEIIGRFIGQLLLEVGFEILVKGTGYLIVKYLIFLNQREVDPDGPLVIIAGILFWVAIAIIII